ncbi:MAG: fe2+ transport protein [Haloarculaceae archaeon]
MRRRALLAAGFAGLSGLAGCAASGGERTSTPRPDGERPSGPSTPGQPGTPPAVGGGADLPDGVYVQRFREGMAMQGTASAGPYTVGLMYAAPHVFWTVSGTDLGRVERAGDVHLMAVVWDPETRTVLPEAGVSVEVTRDGELVSEEVIYPMLSQGMGFHYGANFGLDGDGEYLARVSVGGLGVRRTGALEGRFGDPATVELPFAFTETERRTVTVRELDAYGERGAVRPAEMGMPQALAPEASALPGRVLGTATSDDARLATTVLDGPPAGIEEEGPYLAVSARTRYNRMVLPAMALEAMLSRAGETAFEGALVRTLDPDLGYHYGTALRGVGFESGDELTLTPTLPPQVARHEGYERAFLRMDPATLAVE